MTPSEGGEVRDGANIPFLPSAGTVGQWDTGTVARVVHRYSGTSFKASRPWRGRAAQVLLPPVVIAHGKRDLST